MSQLTLSMNGNRSVSTFALPISRVRVPVGKAIADVGYIDVGPRDGPVVLVVHGAIGGIKDFTDLFESLSLAGNRVLLPEFPGTYFEN